jgi:oxygen-dependent protoporphyrinogen oxidase
MKKVTSAATTTASGVWNPQKKLTVGRPALAGVSVPVLQSSANAAGGPDARRLQDVPRHIRDGADLVIDAAGEEIRARQVIVAAQAPGAASLVAPIADHAADALRRLTYGAFLTVAVETSETAAMPYDDVYAIATPGRAFDMFTNQAHVLRAGGPRRPGGSLMLFAGGRGAGALMGESDAVIVDRFLADLHELFPATRGAVADASLHRWHLGNVYARPGRGRLQPALEGALGRHANLHLAGDYFAALGNMEAAARTGLQAAERVDARIREVTHA